MRELSQQEVDDFILELENEFSFYRYCTEVIGRYAEHQAKQCIRSRISSYSRGATSPQRRRMANYFWERYHHEVFGVEYKPKTKSKPDVLICDDPKPKKEKIDMSKIIETKTFVKGVDASDMSDEAIFDAIAEVEAEIEKLSKVKTQPSKLKKRIEDLKERATELANYVDNR